ncbi:MAG: hypothetical protein RIE32_10445 [Phycisphaerales bacterium]
MTRTNLFTLIVLLLVALAARYLTIVFFDLAAIGATNGVIRDLSASEAVSDSDFQDASKAVYDAIEQNTGYRLVVHLVLDAVIIVSMLWWMGSRRHASSRAVSTAHSTSRIG